MPGGFHCSRTGDSQSGNLAAAMGLSSYYGANKFRVVGHHGNTTFTRFSVDRFVNHESRPTASSAAARCTCGSRCNGTPLHVFNVHLGLNRWQRISQIKQIATWSRSSATPTIRCCWPATSTTGTASSTG